MKRLTGSIFYVAGCLLVILFFDRLVAIASIFVLAVSDPLSSIVGSAWGRGRFLGKSIEGTAAFFLSSVIILACFPFTIPSLFAAAAAASAAELFSSRFIDDNFSIPVTAALVLTILGQ